MTRSAWHERDYEKEQAMLNLEYTRMDRDLPPPLAGEEAPADVPLIQSWPLLGMPPAPSPTSPSPTPSATNPATEAPARDNP